MKRIKTISLLLVISMFASIFSVPVVYAADESIMYYEKGFSPEFYDVSNKDIFESIKSELPAGTQPTITVKGNIIPFNYRLWFAKNIVVYGNYAMIPGNEFKAESESPYGVGYYSKGGKRGEYRYHGFDTTGNYYRNTWWTIDTRPDPNINDNRWIYRPWDNPYTESLSIKESIYNQAAERYTSAEDKATRDWIDRPITKPSDITGEPVTLTFENVIAPPGVIPERKAHRIIHVMSPPSILYPGEAVAWHLGRDNNIYYRTFTLDKLEHPDKLMTDVEAEVKILTPKEKLKVLDFGKKNTTEYLESEISVDVEVSGILKDEEYYNDPIKKVVRYTRYDIKDWTMTLNATDGKYVQDNIKSIDYNKGKAVFTLKYKVKTILSKNTDTLNANARVNFLNNANNNANASTVLEFTVEKVPEIVVEKEMTPVTAKIEPIVVPEELVVYDYGEKNNNEYLNSQILVPVRVIGTLMDESFYNNPEEREKRYNRDDIHSWTMSVNGEEFPGIQPDKNFKNKAEGVITLTLTRRDIINNPTITLVGYAECLFKDSKTERGNATGTIKFTVLQAPQEEYPPIPELPELPPEPPPPPVIVQPNCDVPEIGFDIVPFVATDYTDMEQVASRAVYINGKQVDDKEFFSGRYVFGNGNDGMKKIEIVYESIDGIISAATEWTYIYSTKPTAQFKISGTFKQNRKLTVTENCEEGNTSIVLQHYPIVSYEWRLTTVDTDPGALKAKNPSSNRYREFLCKEPGIYRVELVATNTLGRVSDPYVLDLVIYEDTLPAIELNIWNGVLTRGEQLSLHYSASSVDEDTIASKTLQIYYDSDNDGVCDQLIKTFPNGDFTGFVPDKLGKYRIVATATEEFGQETISEFVTASDRKTKVLENEFWVDNLIPMTDLYINIPIVKPEIDLYIMLDKKLNDTSKQYIMSNRVNFNNYLRSKNILPKVENWDMKTYEYSQTVDDTRYTGESYPPATISYSSGGYSGTLTRYKVVDNGGYEDRGRYVTKTESKSFSRTFNSTVTKTYRYSGGSFVLDSETESPTPPSSMYINEDGYSGSIPKTGRNGPYNSRRHSESYSSKYFSDYHYNTVTDIYKDNKLVSSTHSSPAPSSKYVSSDGYYGYIPRTGTETVSQSKESWYETIDGKQVLCQKFVTTFKAIYGGYLSRLDSYKESGDYVTTYSGTLTKQVQVWESNIVWVSDYIGYYSGTVYKYVRQPYTDPFRPTSYKYVVYISDSTVNELSDLKSVMSKADAKLILVGTEGMKSQISHDLYISKNNPIEEILQEIMDYIATNSPKVEKYYVLAGIDTFEIKTINYDEEGDPIVEEKFQYVQNPNYFDNPTGIETFATTEFSENNNWVSTKVNKFNNVGEFRIYRRIKDRPTTDPNFASYSYYSGIPELIIYAHRKPIANADLDWDYDKNKNIYKTRWVCTSYDLDHQFSREDKGIVERKIMFRKTGGEWYYYIPEELEPGTYELRYYVKDIEGTWSDPFTMNFTLSSSPPIQLLDAKVRAQDPTFSISNIPASEYLEVYDAWTRYPDNVNLELILQDGSINKKQTVHFNSARDTKSGNDIYWGNIAYEIDPKIKDGTYTFKVAAVDASNSAKRAEKDFTVKVNTPINLEPSMPEECLGQTVIDIKADTSKYADTVKVTLFYGTSYQTTINLSGNLQGSKKVWANKYNIPSTVPEGTYTARFTASTPSGKSETKDVQFKVETLKITGVTIEGYWNHWRGQVDIFGRQLTNEPHRFLSFERVRIKITTDGYAEKLEIRFSSELESMQYIDENGNIYDYKDDFNLDYVSFPYTIELDETKKENETYWEYVLPLANSTKSWDDKRIRAPYYMEVTAWKGATSVKYLIDDIDITGNIYDLTYIQPIN